MSYTSENQNLISASKIKDFIIHEYLYKLKYIDKIVLDKKEEDYFTVGTAFHYLMEHWQKKFLDKYSIADSFLKDDLKKLILEKDDSDTMKKWCKNSKTTLEMLRKQYYDFEYWIWRHDNEIKKIQLKNKEWQQILDWYKYALTQDLWDMWWNYYYEEKYVFEYKWFLLSIKPDRYRITKDWKDYSIKEYIDLLKSNNIGVSFEELSDRKVFSEWATCIIRDFKTSSNIERLRSGLMFDDAFWYLISMSWYYVITYLITWIKDTTVLLDVIELQTSYWEVINIPIQELNAKFNWVHEKLLLLMDKIQKWNWELPPHSLIAENKKLKEYAKYIPVQQDVFNYLNVDNNEIY